MEYNEEASKLTTEKLINYMNSPNASFDTSDIVEYVIKSYIHECKKIEDKE